MKRFVMVVPARSCSAALGAAGAVGADLVGRPAGRDRQRAAARAALAARVGVIALLVVGLDRAAWPGARWRRAAQPTPRCCRAWRRRPRPSADRPRGARCWRTRFAEAVATLKAAHGRRPARWLRRRRATCTSCPGTSSSARRARARPPRWSTPACTSRSADRSAAGAVHGVGGTRNCDWWFTDDAVLIDTAGRYTTQDSRPRGRRQRAGTGFLALLQEAAAAPADQRRAADRQRADLLQQGAAERAGARRRAARAPAGAARASSACAPPVYVLVTKSRPARRLHRVLRRPRQGASAPRSGASPSTPTPARGDDARCATSTREFDALQRAAQRAACVERLQHETRRARGARDLRLPAAVRARCRPLLGDFLGQVFAGSARSTQPPLLRGVYFTSGTQEGTPIDRVMGALAPQLRPRQRAALPRRGRQRQELLPAPRCCATWCSPSSGLAGANARPNSGAALLRTGRRRGDGAASPWRCSPAGRYSYAAQPRLRSQPVAPAAAGAASSRSTRCRRASSLVDVAPVLHGLRRSCATRPTSRRRRRRRRCCDDARPLPGRQARRRRRARATSALLERCASCRASRAGSRTSCAPRSKDNLEHAYEALKAYLMLHTPEQFDAEALKAWITLDWDAQPRPRHPRRPAHAARRPSRRAARAGPAARRRCQMDENLVRSVREMLAALSARVPRLQPPQAPARRQRHPELHASPRRPARTRPQVFERISGKPLTEGVPGPVHLRRLSQALPGRRAAGDGRSSRSEEPWVLGREPTPADGVRDCRRSARSTDRVRRLYLRGIRQGLGRLPRRRAAGAARAGSNSSIEIARMLSARRLAAGRPTCARWPRRRTLMPPRRGRQGRASSKAAETVRGTRKGAGRPVRRRPAANAGCAAGKRIESIVDDHFAPLHRLVHAASRRRSTTSLKLFNEVYAQLHGGRHGRRRASRRRRPATWPASKIKAAAARSPSRCARCSRPCADAGASQGRAAERGSLTAS